ncbi:MAG: enoyl-CoA hydratase/isomerase family protein [Clostridia bacterium]|nr:enoyl-CoA hydratase/isomerase family protein [Clostridia bacterium]
MGYIILEQQGHVGIITINRFETLNSLNSDVLSDLNRTLDVLEANEDIYVVILTGKGRSFAAGEDIAEMRDFGAVEGKAFSDFGNAISLRIENFPKPVIAAVNGFALGGGCELAMACDIRIASENAKFSQPEVGLGIIPGFGGTQRLPRIVGIGKAMELILSARTINAAEAKEIGLVNQVVAHEKLMETALELANAIASKAQIAVRFAKQCIRRGMQADINSAANYEALAFGICCDTEDQFDAMNAFVSNTELKGFKNR